MMKEQSRLFNSNIVKFIFLVHINQLKLNFIKQLTVSSNDKNDKQSKTFKNSSIYLFFYLFIFEIYSYFVLYISFSIGVLNVISQYWE